MSCISYKKLERLKGVNRDYSILVSSPPPPHKYAIGPPVFPTEHNPLHIKSLCKNITRAVGGRGLRIIMTN